MLAELVKATRNSLMMPVIEAVVLVIEGVVTILKTIAKLLLKLLTKWKT